MSSGSFLDGLGGFDLQSLLDQLRQAPQGVTPQADATAPVSGLNPFQPVRGAGDVDPSGRGTGPVDQRRPSIAMNEDQAQALERAQASPQDLAALGGSPLDRLLFDRSGFGGGPNSFAGSADPLGSRNVPLPPSRPSDADLLASPTATGAIPPGVSGMNPDRALGMPGVPGHSSITAASTGNPAASNVKPAASYDPLTGQVVSGSPKLMPAPGAGGPTEGAGRVAAQAGAPQAAGQAEGQSDLMSKFIAGVNNPDFSNLMLSLSSGLLSRRGIAEGIGAGIGQYSQSRLGDVKQALQMYQLQQQAQQQNAARAYVRSRGGSQELQDLAAASPSAVLTGGLSSFNAQPAVQEIDGKKYWLKPGDKPGAENYIGDVTDKDPVHFDRDPVTGELTAYRTNQIFPGRWSGATDMPAVGAGIGGGVGAGGGDSADAGNGIARTLIPGNRGVRIYGQPDPRTGQIVQPPPNSPPGVSGYYDASGKPVTLDRSPETERDKAVGGAIGKDIAGYIEAGKPAREKMAALNILDDAWKAGKDKITTGPSAERVLSLKQFARGSLGLNIGDDIAPSELIAKIGTQLATADAKSLTARPTQFDFATYLRNNPGLALTPEGNAALINIKKQQAQHEIDLAALARDHKNWDNWDEVTAAYDKAHPIVSPLTKRALGADEVNFPDPNGQRGDPATRYQQLMRNGMSKSDAFAQMRREGL